MAKKYLTREQILALPSAPVGERVCDMPPDPWLLRYARKLAADQERQIRRIQREIEPLVQRILHDARPVIAAAMEYIADAETPGKPNLAWAFRITLVGAHSGWFSDDQRDLAVEWIADRFAGLPGHPGARTEVKYRLKVLAERERRTEAALRREIVLAATPNAVMRTAIALPARLCRSENERLEKKLGDDLLVIVRRDLGELVDIRGRDLGLVNVPRKGRPPRVDENLEGLPAIVEIRSTEEVERALRVATEAERRVAYALLETGSLADAARQLGREAGGVRNLFGRLLQRLESAETA